MNKRHIEWCLILIAAIQMGSRAKEKTCRDISESSRSVVNLRTMRAISAYSKYPIISADESVSMSTLSSRLLNLLPQSPLRPCFWA
jgi:hypothetical protein